MIFRRKAKAPAQATAERRQQYRKRQSKSCALTIVLQTPAGPVHGDFLDLSVQGAGARFPLEHDPCLQPGAVVELSITSLRHGEVRTPARVVYGQQDGERHLRYGFAFISLGDLYAQLDAFYSRLFNRRRSQRVRPALDRKIGFELAWRQQTLSAPVHEISATGVGLVLPQEEAFRLDGIDELAVRFRLPDVRDALAGRAWIRNRARSGARTFLGLEFDLAPGSGLARHEPALRSYVERRAAEIERWESSWE